STCAKSRRLRLSSPAQKMPSTHTLPYRMGNGVICRYVKCGVSDRPSVDCAKNTYHFAVEMYVLDFAVDPAQIKSILPSSPTVIQFSRLLRSTGGFIVTGVDHVFPPSVEWLSRRAHGP